MNAKKVSAIIAALGTLTIGILPASAEVVATKTADGGIVVSGLTDYSSYTIEYSGAPKIRRASANACGVIALSDSESYPIDSSSSFTRGGTSYTMASLTVGAAPKCSDGNLAATPPASVFKDSNGNVYITGLTAYSNTEITYNSVPSTRRAKANACGIVALRNDANYPLSSSPVMVKSEAGSEVSNFTPNSLTTSDSPICVKGKTYFPEGWSMGS
ncbi:MAG: hypothetical protein CLLPBCKN_006458 [Chroococcidiopsis cubana SAG 39.79]|uniref:Uncharacterized protein n=1 Tax=Chroococcidiopsis cubana SAG 39.79 TaxID=388085 RepID=A0AB37UE63_9CYAN|nr:hypothetical protein [Chroococcidiopsis cubana]MDZ4877023.1 hypothetical protein [Chroococcidiopsis cubana SAG 39.79]PSB62575.1 hypothetical protein C7B79_17515 [Chroococcidiopsis cubana CCALA 043]RUT06354.1 hypothetical protein DSM107010_52370 [Chroococcidiopsis cubana SAG 39.79]